MRSPTHRITSTWATRIASSQSVTAARPPRPRRRPESAASRRAVRRACVSYEEGCRRSLPRRCPRPGVGCRDLPIHARPSVRDSPGQAPTLASMSDALEIRLLGPFEVLADGRPADVSGSKRHALLALLALRRGRVGRSRCAGRCSVGGRPPRRAAERGPAPRRSSARGARARHDRRVARRLRPRPRVRRRAPLRGAARRVARRAARG